MYYIGVDLGTSAVKLLLMEGSGKICNIVSKEYPLFFPHPGWSEQNPEDWFAQSMEGIKELTEGIDRKEVAGIGFGGQMHGLVTLDKDDNVIRPAILWNDGRFLDEHDWRRHLLRPFALFTEIPNRGAADFPESRLRRDHASSALVNAVLQKVLSRAVYGRLCTYVRAHFLSHYGRQHHHPGSRAILSSHALGLLSAGGGRPRLVPRLSGRRGMLSCQPCAQPQGEIIQVTGIIIFILYRHCC